VKITPLNLFYFILIANYPHIFKLVKT